MATPSDRDATDHYQNQVPSMREQFARNLRALKREYEKNGELFTHHYPTAVADLVSDEIRERTKKAAASMMQAVDAGWEPSEDALKQAFIACFNPSDYRKDSFSDLKGAILEFTENIGRGLDRATADTFEATINQVRNDTAAEAISEITMHLRKAVAKKPIAPLAPVPRRLDAGSFSMEDGGIASKIIQYLNDNGESMPSVDRIARDVGIEVGVISDEVLMLDDAGMLDVTLPSSGGTAADGRMRLSTRALTMLAAARKRQRELEEAKKKPTSLASRLIESDLAAARPTLRNTVQNVLAQCAARGIGQSGAMVAAVQGPVVDALRDRVERAIKRIKEAASVDDVALTADDLSAIFDSAVDGIFQDAEKLLLDAAQIMGPNVVEQQRSAIAAMKAELTERAHAELEIFVGTNKPGRSGIVTPSVPSRKVFITHGRDASKRHELESFIYSLKLEPIVLEDKPSGGLTIIEKYEKHSEGAGYGIVIVTPDDVGCLKGDEPDGLKPRSRQNVIFELGYMYANISRHKVAVLLTDKDIELPSNIDGIVWVYMDDHGGWKRKLEKELREAGVIG